jgi:purine-nucleoside phosphorylase
MLLDDHINLQGGSPLAFKNVSDFGERFTDMCAPYDASLNARILSIAKENNIVLHKGNLRLSSRTTVRNKAEYRYLKC